jgi:hypothetical protein
VIVDADEAEAQPLGALGDGDIALAIAEHAARRGRHAEVHRSASPASPRYQANAAV